MMPPSRTHCEKSTADSFVDAFPNGADSILDREFDDNGEVLSGGQAQMISIAHVHAKGSPIVILDEPSSALDPIAEQKMYENMMASAEGKTVVFISHRMSACTLADRIVVLDHGRVLECGSHAELMKTLNRSIVLITSAAIMATINPWISLIAALVAVVSVILNRNTMLLSVRRNVALNPLTRKSSYYERIFSQPDMAKEVRISHVSDVVLDDYESNIGEIRKTEQKFNREGVKYSLPGALIERLMEPVVYIIVLYLIMVKKTASIGDLAIVVTTFKSIKSCLSDLLQSLTSFEEHALFTEKVRTLLEYKPKLKSGELPVPEFESLELKNVCFSYPNGEEVLHDVSLSVRRGERIAFVGYNGAGKSTLVKLILHFYEPTSGVILLNGTDIREYDAEAYRRSIGSVFQDFQIYALSLSENVLCDEVSPSDSDAVSNALRAASFGEKLAQLPEGLNTELTREFSDDGTNLSGGEAQKVAVSRIFARPYRLILMNEPSASLDPEAENEINGNISRLGTDKTVVCISHRLSTTRCSDRIYVFDGGRLAEEGTHQQLMALGGRYAEMFEAQAKKYTAAETG